jgi:hypothetical protein
VYLKRNWDLDDLCDAQLNYLNKIKYFPIYIESVDILEEYYLDHDTSVIDFDSMIFPEGFIVTTITDHRTPDTAVLSSGWEMYTNATVYFYTQLLHFPHELAILFFSLSPHIDLDYYIGHVIVGFIQKLAKAGGYNPYSLSEKIGMKGYGKSNLYSFMHGRALPTYEQFEVICKAMGCDNQEEIEQFRCCFSDETSFRFGCTAAWEFLEITNELTFESHVLEQVKEQQADIDFLETKVNAYENLTAKDDSKAFWDFLLAQKYKPSISYETAMMENESDAFPIDFTTPDGTVHSIDAEKLKDIMHSVEDYLGFLIQKNSL